MEGGEHSKHLRYEERTDVLTPLEKIPKVREYPGANLEPFDV